MLATWRFRFEKEAALSRDSGLDSEVGFSKRLRSRERVWLYSEVQVWTYKLVVPEVQVWRMMLALPGGSGLEKEFGFIQRFKSR